MNQVNVKVAFYLKKSEADAKGNCPVMARLTVGKYSEAAFSLKMSVPHTMWHSGRATGKSVAAREINRQLDEIRATALSIFQEQIAIFCIQLFKTKLLFLHKIKTYMTHKYYDFYMRFPSFEDAEKAQKFYEETHKTRIGGKFVINGNGVCSLSITDECELICDLYQFGMKRFIVVDNYHGQNRKDGKMYFDFQTDTDVLYSFLYDEEIFENINQFLKEDIYKDGYENQGDEYPPIIKRIVDGMGIDDLYDMLSVNAPGFDI